MKMCLESFLTVWAWNGPESSIMKNGWLWFEDIISKQSEAHMLRMYVEKKRN